MAKSDKSVGVNASGLTDAINWAKETYEKAKDYVTSVDPGSIAGQLESRDTDVAKQIDQITGAPEPKKPEKKTPQTKNPELQKAHKKKLSAAEAEKIRAEIQRRKAAGEKAPAVKREDI